MSLKFSNSIFYLLELVSRELAIMYLFDIFLGNIYQKLGIAAFRAWCFFIKHFDGSIGLHLCNYHGATNMKKFVECLRWLDILRISYKARDRRSILQFFDETSIDILSVFGFSISSCLVGLKVLENDFQINSFFSMKMTSLQKVRKTTSKTFLQLQLTFFL